MTALIFIAMLVILVLLGAWWLKHERIRRKNELLTQGKVASGDLALVEAELEKANPKPKRKRKRAIRGPDGKKIEIIEPSQPMLDDWLKAAAEVVDKLMPAVHAHQAALANLGRLEEKSKALSAKPLTHEPENCTTNEAAVEWLQAINLDCLRSQEALEQIEEAQVEAKKLEKQVNDLWLQLFYKRRGAENWELYRAPESFHRQLSLIGLLVDRLDNTYGVLATIKKDFQPSKKEKLSFWSRAKQAAQHARDEEDTKDNTPDSTQKAAPNCGELLQAAAAILSKALVNLVSIEERKAHALSLQRIYSQKVQDPPLKGPTSPDSALVDDLLDTIETWAGELYTAQLNAAAMAVTLYDHLVALAGYLEEMQAHISGWQDLPKTREEAIQAHALTTAHSLLSKAVDYLNNTFILLLRTRSAATEPQLDDGAIVLSRVGQEALASLRNNMRKACFAHGQLESALKALERTGANKPVLAEVVKPGLAQTSAEAFLNTHKRMQDISRRNQEKMSQYNSRVNEANKQVEERKQLFQHALQATQTALALVKQRNSEKNAAALATASIAAHLLLNNVLRR